ncbi:hypothetical protein GPECTOR_25g426 [Gonium pectorale]|uniref:Ankyrin repeat domain-containing protein n=1 Tax=Gonium pectorale TaxID=33097 RepID=A0A150GG75_GONPE|nr:hypothetical protein GPECTOR_25g426 [Gonium pectorale]|eukprot:KXZ48841.1 hypothetical protein GPECTOR_25g426 [Gonium pectorale]
MAAPPDVVRAAPNIWLPGLVERFASCLGPNFVACTLRQVNKATAEQFRGRPEYPSTVRLSQPVPQHAFAARWAPRGAMRDLTLTQRQRLLRLTAASGVVANLEVALGAVGVIPDSQLEEEILGAAAAGGLAAAVRCILGFGYGDTHVIGKTLCTAAGAGHQAVCEVLLADDRAPGVTADDVAAALRGGHSGLADWLLQQRWEGPISPADSLEPLGEEGCSELLRAATEGCDLPTLQSIHQRCSEVVNGDDGMVRIAASSRTTDWRAKVEWWELQLPPDWLYDDPGVCTAAARCPYAETRLAWLLGRGYSVERAATDAALGAGNAAALELLLRRGLLPEPRSVTEAARGGRLEALMKLAEYGCPVDAAEVALAALRQGPLSVLAWAVEELGASVQALATAATAWNVRNLDDPEVLRWLWRRGCPLNGSRVALLAARCGQLDALEWAAQELGASMRSDELMDAAGASGSIEVMAWLRERGCPWGPDTFAGAAGSGCEAALEWLAERGCPMVKSNPRRTAYRVGGRVYNGRAMPLMPDFEAASNNDLAALRCLARLGCPWGDLPGITTVFNSCLAHPCRPMPVLRLLVELGCPAVYYGRAPIPADVRKWLEAVKAEAEGVAQ